MESLFFYCRLLFINAILQTLLNDGWFTDKVYGNREKKGKKREKLLQRGRLKGDVILQKGH